MRFGGRSPPLSLDAEIIRRLADLLTETGLTEIEYTVGDRRIRVVRTPAGVWPGSLGAAGPVPAPASGSAPSPSEAGLIEHKHAVTAPMVGVAYLAPQPGAPPFVRLGDTVVAGQPLLIIEAMKVMNEIRAPWPGRVSQILVEDAEPVEYGAMLMLIE